MGSGGAVRIDWQTFTRAEVDAEVERLRVLGATVIRKHDQDWGPYPEDHWVMADPEGNEFCVQ